MLKTIITSLSCFISEKPLSALDFLDIQGSGDVLEESKGDKDIVEADEAIESSTSAPRKAENAPRQVDSSLPILHSPY